MAVLFFLAVCLLIGSAAAAGKKSSCTKIDSCTCNYDDGFVIDLKKMAGLTTDKTPMFSDKIPTESDKKFHYSYKPCYAFDQSPFGFCLNVASCQMDTSSIPPGEINAGMQDYSVFWEEGDEKYMIKYSDYQTGPLRETYVTLTCAGSDSLEVRGELTGSNPSRYDYTLYTPQACRGGAGGLSVGTVLCILFIVFLFVYILGGVLFMMFKVGASGSELVPNLTFWKDFPALIKDGACLAISPCRKGNYSKI